MISLPYASNSVIECIADCDKCVGMNRTHRNCMTTGNRYYLELKRSGKKPGHWCPYGKKEQWRFITPQICDQCGEPFEEVVAWWKYKDVVDYIKACGISHLADENNEPQVNLCEHCIQEILKYSRGNL